MSGGIEFTAQVKFEILPAKVSRLLDSPDGPVGLATNRAAHRVLAKARDNVGKTWSGTTGKPKEPRPSPLRDSGVVESAGGARWSVRFNHPIAVIHHNGSVAHTIPKGGQPNKSIGGKARVYLYNAKIPWGPRFSAVNHPGHEGNPFLTDAIEEAGLRPSGALMRGATLVPLFRQSSNFF